MTPDPGPTIRPPAVPVAVLCLGLAALALAVFYPSVRNDFINLDDPGYVTENVMVLKGLTWQGAAWAFHTIHFSNWHPVTWLSHMVDVQLFGLDADRHHLTNVILHALNSILLLLVLFRMTGALWRSAFVAALFAVHPLHVESVAWVAERKDVLSTLFWFLTLAAWLEFVRSRKLAWYLWVVLLYAVGLMSKPMLVTLPFTLLLLDFWPLGRLSLPLTAQSKALRRLIVEKVPLFALSAASCVVTFMAQKGGGAVMPLDLVPFPARVANCLLSYVSYLSKTIWPNDLSVFYPYRVAGAFSLATVGAAVLLAAVTVLAVKLAKRAPYLGVGWLWYLGTLVPVIGLVQVGSQSMADRYTYVPLIGIFLALVWGIADLASKKLWVRTLSAVVAAGVLAGLSFMAHRQVGYWKNSRTLFEHALAVTADNALAHNNLGIVLFDKGQVETAIEHYRMAIGIDPNYADAYNNMGIALAWRGNLPEALAKYQEALRFHPDNSVLCAQVASVLAQMNRPQEALPYIERAKRDYPVSYLHLLNLGMAMKDLGRFPEAFDYLKSALALQPDSAKALTCMGELLGRMDKLPEATDYFQKALEVDPRSVDTLVNLGVALDRQGRSSEAVETFRKALRIDSRSSTALSNLGMTLAGMNRFQEAIEILQEALRANPSSVDALVKLGTVLDHEGRTQEALELFQKARRIDPESPTALKNLGMTLWRVNRISEAIEALSKAAENEPMDAEVQYALGFALARSGRYVEARDRFREALRLRPDDARSRTGLQKVEQILQRRPGGK